MNSSTDRLVRATTRAALVAGLLLGAPAGVFGQSVNLNQLTLEDLLQVEVSSVSRKSQPVGRTAAAIHVITREDIRRSGAQTIPDLLRMVPGFNIAQVDGGTWAISARGVPEVYSNKLLVLVDGRSVYTPFFGGVNWDMQNLPLDEIERIEVIRGPGGSVWGANATNGVVNILTRSAENTHGGLASVELGGRLPADTHARYGGSFGPGVHYRAYARRVARGRDVELAGIQVSDPAESFVAGSRLDFARGQNRFTLHASAQTGRSERVRRNFQLTTLTSRYAPELTTFHGGNIVLGWTHTSGPESDSGVQVYYDHQQRSSSIVDSWHTLDVDARHRRKLGGRHEVVVGAGYRYWFNDVTNGVFRVVPASERMGTLSAFAQDEIELVKNRLRATAGVKLERSRFTGAGFQPTARLTWTLHESHAFWGAAPRAVRTPTRVDRGMFVPVGAGRGPAGRPLVVTLEGNPEFQPEILRAAEGGYRFNRGTVSLDAVAFDNYYDDLAGIETGSLTRSDDPPNSWRLPGPARWAGGQRPGVPGDHFGGWCTWLHTCRPSPGMAQGAPRAFNRRPEPRARAPGVRGCDGYPVHRARAHGIRAGRRPVLSGQAAP